MEEKITFHWIALFELLPQYTGIVFSKEGGRGKGRKN